MGNATKKTIATTKYASLDFVSGSSLVSVINEPIKIMIAPIAINIKIHKAGGINSCTTVGSTISSITAMKRQDFQIFFIKEPWAASVEGIWLA